VLRANTLVARERTFTTALVGGVAGVDQLLAAEDAAGGVELLGGLAELVFGEGLADPELLVPHPTGDRLGFELLRRSPSPRRSCGPPGSEDGQGGWR
jgi:hypothetical protein